MHEPGSSGAKCYFQKAFVGRRVCVGGKQGHENIEEPVGPERHLAPASTIIEATHG